MSKSVAFYKDVLGFKVDFESPYWSQFTVGHNKIGLHPKLVDTDHPLGVFGKGWYLGLETDDIVTLRATLESHAVKIHGTYHDVPGGVVLDFEDPAGNPIEAYQQGLSVAKITPS
jgi:catechol 2,3-dioxygenase-like lactoylglutathione lyase family enzyme